VNPNIVVSFVWFSGSHPFCRKGVAVYKPFYLAFFTDASASYEFATKGDAQPILIVEGKNSLSPH